MRRSGPALPYGPEDWDLELLPNGNYEFSLRKPYLGNDIMPIPRDQGGDETCVSQALCSTGETDAFRSFADEQRPSNNVRFDAYSFANQYVECVGMSLAEENKTSHLKPIGFREDKALLIFENEGVAATSDDWENTRKIKLAHSRKMCHVSFAQVARQIHLGRCVAGSLPVDSTLQSLGPEDMYEFKDEAVIYPHGHMVVFVGYGIEGEFSSGRPYLEFLGSNGTLYRDGGFGKAYFDSSVHHHRMYVLTVEQMPTPTDSLDDALDEAFLGEDPNEVNSN